MPGLDEFDLDIRLHGMPAGHFLQGETDNRDCPDFTLAVTCNTCEASCGGTCEETCGDQATCPLPTCELACQTNTCEEQSCGCDTNTCIQQNCQGDAITFPAQYCEDPSDGCGDPGGPGGGDVDNPDETVLCPHPTGPCD
jgi:hypothetical protein